MPESNNNSAKNISNSTSQNESRFKSLIDDLKRLYPSHLTNSEKQTIAVVSVTEQTLFLFKNEELVKRYLISTAEAGIGNLSGSYQTPLGVHRIAEKIGDNAPTSSIFKGRVNSNEIAEIIHEPEIRSAQDNITSRILWLDGLEDGLNKGQDKDNNHVDSYSRYIYIHGTDEEGLLGKVASHGCVRMANEDVIELYKNIDIDDLVVIVED